MSTIPPEPDFTQPPIVVPTGAQLADETARYRAAADLSAPINAQIKGTDLMMQTLVAHLEGVRGTVESLPGVFDSMTKNIEKSTRATQQLASANRTNAQHAQAGAKAMNDQKFSIIEMVTNLAHGNLGGAIGEAFQGIPGTVGARTNLAQRISDIRAGQGTGSFLERLTGRGVTAMTTTGDVAATAGSGAGGIGSMLKIGGLLGAESLMTPAAIFGAYKLFGSINASQQASQRLGALTGEGIGAGIAAGGINLPIFGRIGGEVGALRSMNPFDLVGNKEAMQIVEGVRGSGFRGAEARQLEESIKGMVNDLGVGVDQAMKIAIPAVKEAGFSTQQLSDTMSTLDDTAKNAHTSIGELTDAVAGLITSAGQFSRRAAQAAPGQLQGLESQFQGTLIARTPGSLAGFLQGPQREMIAELSGFAPYEAYSQKFTAQFNADFTKILVNLARAKPAGMDWQEYVAMMMLDPMWQQLFGQTPIPDIIDLLTKVWQDTAHGTQVGKYLNRQQKQAFQQRMQPTIGRAKSLGTDILDHYFSYNPVHPGAIDKVDQQKIISIDQQLQSAGVGKNERTQMERNIKNAIRSQDVNGLRNSLDAIAKRIEEASKNFHAKTTVTVDPRYGRMLRTVNTDAISAARGQRAKQGTTDINP